MSPSQKLTFNNMFVTFNKENVTNMIFKSNYQYLETNNRQHVVQELKYCV
jgi:hypothetical protein